MQSAPNYKTFENNGKTYEISDFEMHERGGSFIAIDAKFMDIRGPSWLHPGPIPISDITVESMDTPPDEMNRSTKISFKLLE
jgi:hypothetical protein